MTAIRVAMQTLGLSSALVELKCQKCPRRAGLQDVFMHAAVGGVQQCVSHPPTLH